MTKRSKQQLTKDQAKKEVGDGFNDFASKKKADPSAKRKIAKGKKGGYVVNS